MKIQDRPWRAILHVFGQALDRPGDNTLIGLMLPVVKISTLAWNCMRASRLRASSALTCCACASSLLGSIWTITLMFSNHLSRYKDMLVSFLLLCAASFLKAKWWLHFCRPTSKFFASVWHQKKISHLLAFHLLCAIAPTIW